MSAGFAAASKLQLLRRDALLRNFNFQPQVLSAVRTAPFEGYHVVGPEPKVLQSRVRAIRQADRMAGSSVTFAKQKEVKTSTKTSSKKTAPRPSVFDRLGSPPSTTQRTVTQESPFRAGARRARPRPFQGSKKSGKTSSCSATRQRWRVPGGGSPGRLCPALAESAGQLPGHRHRRGRGGHCIPATTSAHPSKHQFPDQEQPTKPSASRRCLADEGSHRASHQREVPGFLQSVVSGSQEDRRSTTCDRPVHSQPPHGSSTLQDGDARVRPISHQKSGVDGVDRHTRCLSLCADASGCPQVSVFRGQQEGVPVHLSSVWTGDFSTGVHQAAETRSLAVEAARCEATRLLRRLADQGRYTGRSSTARPDNHQGPPVSRLDHQLREVRPHTKSRLPVHWDAVQHSTFHSGAPAENACKGPVSSSALDGQSEHNCQRSAQTSRHAGVHGLAGPARTAPSSSSPMVGRHSMVPEDRELVRPDSSSTVGSVRGGMVVPAVPQGLPLATKETEVTLFTDASSLGWGAQLGSRSTQGQWSAFQRSCHINVLEMQTVIYAVNDFLPHLRYRVVRLMCDNTVTVAYIKNEGGTRSHTLMQMTIRLLKWWDSKAITLVPVHLPGVRNIQVDSLSRVGETLTTEWTMAMESPCLPSGANHSLICLRHSPTDDSSCSYHHIWSPGRSGQMPCPCPGTRRGAFCTPSRHSRWSLKFCRRLLNHQECRWYWSLNCNRQHHGSQSWWTYPKKTPFHWSSKVKTCWHKRCAWEGAWLRLVTSGRQIFTRGNSQGHSESERSFQGSCQHDVKMPTRIFTTSVWISLIKIRGVL